jgi:FtsP/CotA-like multicopper oxidase with cupredoxin domain
MLRSIASLVACCAWALTASAKPIDVLKPGAKIFDLYVTWGSNAPDGFSREMLLVNGISPGPVIELDQDDNVVVNVHNWSPFNSSVHFHGR